MKRNFRDPDESIINFHHKSGFMREACGHDYKRADFSTNRIIIAQAKIRAVGFVSSRGAKAADAKAKPQIKTINLRV